MVFMARCPNYSELQIKTIFIYWKLTKTACLTIVNVCVSSNVGPMAFRTRAERGLMSEVRASVDHGCNRQRNTTQYFMKNKPFLLSVFHFYYYKYLQLDTLRIIVLKI